MQWEVSTQFDVGVDFDPAKVEDGESADIVLSGSLPLLRGAGMVNLEPLIASLLLATPNDFEEIRANPKIIIGYSDITALHMAFAARAGFPTTTFDSSASWP